MFLRNKTSPRILGLMLIVGLAASTLHFGWGKPAERQVLSALRISPVLHQNLRSMNAVERASSPIPLIVQLKPEFYRQLEEQQQADGHRPGNALPLVHGYQTSLSANQIDALLASDLVQYVTQDAVIRPTSNPFTDALGLQQYFSATRSKSLLGYTGKGIRVALFDSGMYSHDDLGGMFEVQVDFTGGGAAVYKDRTDPYGHGTGVAGVIGGKGGRSRGEHSGVATEVDFVVLRVVGPDGAGKTSDLIRAIDWAISNRETYQIRVANLSLGHPPYESYLSDPLCQAVEKMVEAGIVTVVSAGNLGKTKESEKLWQSISSPGIDPAVITVGAVNSRGTATHGDIIGTTFSSRGPSIDGLFKPDLVAPGNRVPTLFDPNGKLAMDYPELVLDSYYMQLSGSSIASGYVAGVAALMLDANPALTPRMVKMLLMMTAVRLPGAELLEQGNGLVNAYTAVKLAEALDVPSRQLLTEVPPAWTLGDEVVWAGGAMAFGDQIAYSHLVDPGGPTLLWGGGFDWASTLQADGFFWADGLFDSNSPFWLDDGVQPDAFVWTEGSFWADGLLWADGFMWADGFLWADQSFWSDGFLWADVYSASASNQTDMIFNSDSYLKPDEWLSVQEEAQVTLPKNWVAGDSIYWVDSVLEGDAY